MMRSITRFRSMKRLVVIATVAMSIIASAQCFAEAGDQPEQPKGNAGPDDTPLVVVNIGEGDTLSVHSAPGKQYSVIGHLLEGTGKIAVLESAMIGSTSWMRIRVGNIEGWVNGKYIGPAPQKASGTQAASPTPTFSESDGLNAVFVTQIYYPYTGKHANSKVTVRPIVISPDGLHVATIVENSDHGDNEKGSKLFVDGAQIGEADVIESPMFSREGSHVIYVQKNYNSDDYNLPPRPTVAIDGTIVSNGFKWASNPILGPDGQHFAYFASDRTDGTTDSVVEDGKTVKKLGKEESFGADFLFSPDSTRIAYSVWTGGSSAKCFVVIGGSAEGEHDSAGSLTFSPDSKHYAYLVYDGLVGRVVLDGSVIRDYFAIGGIAFSPDSKHLAYIACNGEKYFVVVDGTAGRGYDLFSKVEANNDPADTGSLTAPFGVRQIEGEDWEHGEQTIAPLFSPNSKHIAYLAGDYGGGYSIVLDGTANTSFGGCAELAPVFSPDSEHLAYISYRDKKNSPVVDGKEGFHYDSVEDVGFSPDGDHLFYVALTGTTEQLFLDDKACARYDWISPRPTFQPDGELGFFAVRNGSLYRVTYKPSR